MYTVQDVAKNRRSAAGGGKNECQLFPTGAALQNEDPDPSVRMDRIRILHVRMN